MSYAVRMGAKGVGTPLLIISVVVCNNLLSSELRWFRKLDVHLSKSRIVCL